MLHSPSLSPRRVPLAALAAVLLSALFAAPLLAQADDDLEPVEVARIKSEIRLREADTAKLRASIARPTRELIVFLKPGADPVAYARDHGLSLRRAISRESGIYILAADSVQSAQRRRDFLRLDSRTRQAFVNELVQRTKLAFVPNDPYYNLNNPTGYPGQWHLNFALDHNLDAQVVGAWNRDLTGQGVTIGIVDDGVPGLHPDLAGNFSADKSYDFGDDDSDPSPVLPTDIHGTAVAGVAAARGGNGIGITGAAPHASIAGLRVLFGAGANIGMFVDATTHLSEGPSPTIQVKNHSYGVLYPFVDTDAEVYAVQESAAAGTIHVFAAGNSRNPSDTRMDDTARQDMLNSPAVIPVAAMGSNGSFASYSCYGANVFVTAPSNSFLREIDGLYGITTTDRVGADGYNRDSATDQDPFPDIDYTGGFGGTPTATPYTGGLGGTSSAAPLVAGIMALGKQANPEMDVRLAKHLLARTSDAIHLSDTTSASDGGWKLNDAGFHFNQNYGFGRIDAHEFTGNAPLYKVSPLQTEYIGLTVVNAPIPDADRVNGLTQTFNVSSTTPLEEVLIHLNITHTWHGDVAVYLTSPRGTRCRMLRPSLQDSDDGIQWSILSNAFWGENPQGTWTLQVYDWHNQDTGTLVSFSVTMRMGTLIEKRSIGGKVTANGTGLAGATVTLTGPSAHTTTTAADGTYNVENLLAGTYVVKAAKPGYVFSPAQQSVNTILGAATANFTATIEHQVARDVAVAGDGSQRILLVGLTSIRILKVVGTYRQAGEVYPIGAGWTPLCIAAGPDGRTHLLWRHTTGLVSLWRINAAGVRDFYLAMGPYSGWTARDIGVASDGSSRILYTTPSQARILKVTGGTVQTGVSYPIAAGWTPLKIAAGLQARTHLLWRNSSGLVSLWRFNSVGTRDFYLPVGPYTSWTAQDIGVASDGSSRILYTTASQARIINVNGASIQIGATYPIEEGWMPVAIAGSPEAKTHLLWGYASGLISLWRMNSAGTRETAVGMGPF